MKCHWAAYWLVVRFPFAATLKKWLMSHLYSTLPQIFHPIKGALQLQVPPQLRPFTVSFLFEDEPPPPRSTPWEAYRSQGCHIMVTQLAWPSYSDCTYPSTYHHCQVPILHLGEVRQHGAHILPQDVTWSVNWQHWDSNPWLAHSKSHALSIRPPHLHLKSPSPTTRSLNTKN